MKSGHKEFEIALRLASLIGRLDELIFKGNQLLLLFH